MSRIAPDYLVGACRHVVFVSSNSRTGKESRVSHDQNSGTSRRLPRHQSRRPLPLAGRRRSQIEGRRRLGRGREQGHLRFPESIPQRDAHQEADDGTVELREDRRAVQERRPLLLFSRTTACRTRACCFVQDTLDGEAAGAARPEHLDQGRHGRPRRHRLSATTGNTSPTEFRRPAPTGTRGRSWISPPANRWTTN